MRHITFASVISSMSDTGGEYAFYDIDANGIAELFIRYETAMDDYTKIYTYVGGATYELAEFWSRSSLEAIDNDGIIYRSGSSGAGDRSFEAYRISDDKKSLIAIGNRALGNNAGSVLGDLVWISISNGNSGNNNSMTEYTDDELIYSVFCGDISGTFSINGGNEFYFGTTSFYRDNGLLWPQGRYDFMTYVTYGIDFDYSRGESYFYADYTGNSYYNDYMEVYLEPGWRLKLYLDGSWSANYEDEFAESMMGSYRIVKNGNYYNVEMNINMMMN